MSRPRSVTSWWWLPLCLACGSSHVTATGWWREAITSNSVGSSACLLGSWNCTTIAAPLSRPYTAHSTHCGGVVVTYLTGHRIESQYGQQCVSGKPLSYTSSPIHIKTHPKSHLSNISFPSVWLYHWLFFVQSPWSRLCCIGLSKFIIITLHYITSLYKLQSYCA